MGKHTNKRKHWDTDEVPPKRIRSPTCILHVLTLSEYGHFTTLSTCKGGQSEKLSYLHSIRDMRLKEASSSPYRMTDICDQIPSTLEGLDLETTGYHQNCYKSFTGNLHRLQVSKASLSSEPSSSIKDSLRHLKSLSSQSEGARCTFLFPNQCIFCDKAKSKLKGKTEELTKFQSWKHKEPAWKVIEPRAQELKKEALYRKVQGKDLFAMEAQYHPTCRMHFNTEYQNHVRGKQRAEKAADSIDSLEAQKIAAHKSYCVVKDYILSNVIEGKEVVQLRFLCNLYMKTLENEGFPNPKYRSEKLARRLQGDKDISREVTISKVPHHGCIELNLIYSSSITVDEAVVCAYKLGTADQLQETALTLHSHIIKAFKESKELPWPPTAQELDAVKMDKLLPEHLVQFLRSVVTGTLEGELCEKTQRLVYSIAQDVCRAATSSQWKLPKHILLCATLRHLYRSKQVSNMLIYSL